MSDIIDFKPQSHLKAAAQLDAFIAWAQTTLPKGIPNELVQAGIRWDMSSWHKSGIHCCAFTVHGSPRNAKAQDKKYMQPPFIDFAKALVVYSKVFKEEKSVKEKLSSAKVLETALVELSDTRDVTLISAAICNRACEYYQAAHPLGDNAYNKSKMLEQIVLLMSDKGLLAKPFRWTSPLRKKQSGTLKEQKKNHDKKLPSRESILALGELFNNDLTCPLDITTLSACALLLSLPSRIGELADVEHNCVIYKEEADSGKKRMFLRWYAEKGFGASTKPVVKGMESSVERAIKLIATITEEARTYAAWLEDHPDEFPPHEDLPLKGQDDPLTYKEACLALKADPSIQNSPRTYFRVKWLNILEEQEALSPHAQAVLDEIREGWDTSRGKSTRVNGKRHYNQFDDKAAITLRKLNILMREKYLPKNFPYTTPAESGKKRVKYRDALFTVRTGSLNDKTKDTVAKRLDFGVEISASVGRLSHQLGGTKITESIFKRHGYQRIRVNTHAFRHELNTEMHRAGLSQLLIDVFSGRTSMGSVYNHETVEERTAAVTAVHPKTKQSNAALRLEKIRTNEPLRLSDVTDLEVNSQDRVIHQTHLGICVHRFESEPCPKMGACLTCGNLGCVKGDDVKLGNLKEERADLKKRYEKALAAEAQEELGAVVWREKAGLDLFKCNALIKTLENPELEQGDIVWNADNGWNLTNNAAVMAGLIDAKTIEAPKEAELPSLEDLSAMLNEIEI
ncbi:MAG: hypothetical protein JKY50_07810 [Oleispira sp.]|nr:hypothetical protein [Oleispira sp.]